MGCRTRQANPVRPARQGKAARQSIWATSSLNFCPRPVPYQSDPSRTSLLSSLSQALSAPDDTIVNSSVVNCFIQTINLLVASSLCTIQLASVVSTVAIAASHNPSSLASKTAHQAPHFESHHTLPHRSRVRHSCAK